MVERTLSRRGLIAGMAAAALARPARADGLAAILERSGLGAVSGFALADAATGEILEAHQGDIDRAPASVAKIVTALYGLDRLGPSHRFATRLIAGGPVAPGRIEGDLVLAGGGDPLLDTDGLGDLAAELRAGGTLEVRGAFRVAAGALPALPWIGSDQPAQAGYNPAISGMNLNFNRVHLAWEPGGAAPKIALSAPGLRFSAPAPSIAYEFGGKGEPRHRLEAEREVWTLAAASLKGRGSVWLPVREPARYAGEAFRALSGLDLGPPVAATNPDEGAALAERRSPALREMMIGMLDHSTNLTAEVAGLAASGAPDLAASGAIMTDWARARYGLRRAVLVNHSGLTAQSVISPVELVRMLVRAQPEGLPELLQTRGLRDAKGNPLVVPGVQVLAKTGTLHFVSALAGYIERPQGRRVFAILAADPERRAAVPPNERSNPPGAKAWAGRARAQQQALLRRWIGV